MSVVVLAAMGLPAFVSIGGARAQEASELAPPAASGDAVVEEEEPDELAPEDLEAIADPGPDSGTLAPESALATTGVVIGSANLALALEEIERSPQAQDLLTVFPERYPELVSDFADYLLQYRTDGRRPWIVTDGGGVVERVGYGPNTSPLTQADVGNCNCIFAMRADAMPGQPIDLYHRIKNHLWREGTQGPEAAQWVKVNRTGNSIFGGGTYIDSQLVESQVKFTMELRCRRLRALIQFVVMGITIRLPVWGPPCPRQCEGTIDNTGQLYLDGKTHLVRGLTAGANAEVMGYGFYGVNQTAQINKTIQISKAIEDLAFGINITVPGFGTLQFNSGTGMSFGYNAGATGPTVGVTWTSPGKRGDTLVSAVASNDYDITVSNKAESIFKSASRVYAKAKGTAVSRAEAFVSYGMGMHGFAECARESWYGHAALWGYESHKGYNDSLRNSLRGFYEFHGMPNVPQ